MNLNEFTSSSSEDINEEDNYSFNKSMVNQYNKEEDDNFENNEKSTPDINIININPLKDKKSKDEKYFLKIHPDLNKENKKEEKEKKLGYVDILLMNNKINKNKTKNESNTINTCNHIHFNINNNKYDLTEKDIENIKQKINDIEKEDEFDNNNPFRDISKIIKKNIMKNKAKKTKEKNKVGYSHKEANKKVKYKSSKNMNNIPLKMNEKKKDENNNNKKINNKSKTKIKKVNEEDKKYSYKDLYKIKIKNKKEKIKDNIDNSLNDIII